MNSQRIEMLKKMISEDSKDPFYPYALALEYIHTNRMLALSILKDVLNQYPNYLPTYYQAGLLSIEVGEVEEGQAILGFGVTLAKKQNDRKALHELQSLLYNLDT